MTEQAERVLPPVGRFSGKVVAHDMGKADSGNPQVAVKFELKDEEGATHFVNWYGVFTDKTIANEYGPIHWLRQLGWDVEERGWRLEELGAKSDSNKVGGALVGREADITVEHSEFKNKTTARVQYINEPGGGMLKDRCDTPESLRDVCGAIRSLAGAGAGPVPSTGSRRAAAPKPSGASAPASSARKAPAPTAAESDLPF